MAKVQFYTHAPTNHKGVEGETLIAKCIRDDTNLVAQKLKMRDAAVHYDLWDDAPEAPVEDFISVYRVTVERLDSTTLEPVAAEGFDVV